MPDVWTVFHWRRGEIHSQVADEGLQMADRLCAASAASNLELLWGCCQGLVHDIFVIQADSVFGLNCQCHHVTEFSAEPETGIPYQ